MTRQVFSNSKLFMQAWRTRNTTLRRCAIHQGIETTVLAAPWQILCNAVTRAPYPMVAHAKIELVATAAGVWRGRRCWGPHSAKTIAFVATACVTPAEFQQIGSALVLRSSRKQYLGTVVYSKSQILFYLTSSPGTFTRYIDILAREKRKCCLSAPVTQNRSSIAHRPRHHIMFTCSLLRCSINQMWRRASHGKKWGHSLAKKGTTLV